MHAVAFRFAANNPGVVVTALQAANDAREKAFSGNPFYRAGTPTNSVLQGTFPGGTQGTEFGQATQDPGNFGYFYANKGSPDKDGFVTRLSIFDARQAQGSNPNSEVA